MTPFLFFWVAAAAIDIEPPLPVPPPAPPIVEIPAPRPAPHPRPAAPIGNPGNWVNSGDYPPSALRAEVGGTTAFLLRVDPLGKVSRCDVTGTSGTPLLDATTCALITERALFVPATDRKGRPVAGTYSSRVRWVIPDRPDRPEPGVLVFSYIAEVDGSVSNCRVERQEGAAMVVPSDSDWLCPRGLNEPFRDEAGNPVRKVVRTTTGVSVKDLPPPADR